MLVINQVWKKNTVVAAGIGLVVLQVLVWLLLLCISWVGFSKCSWLASWLLGRLDVVS